MRQAWAWTREMPKTNQCEALQNSEESGWRGSGNRRNIHLVSFPLRFAVITEHQAFSVAFLSSCLWGILREYNNIIASHPSEARWSTHFHIRAWCTWREILFSITYELVDQIKASQVEERTQWSAGFLGNCNAAGCSSVG